MKQEMQAPFWLQIYDGSHCLEDAGVYGKIISKLILKKQILKMCTGLN
jgi:hypothetical protein